MQGVAKVLIYKLNRYVAYRVKPVIVHLFYDFGTPYKVILECRWSVNRPSVFFTGRIDGTFEVLSSMHVLKKTDNNLFLQQECLKTLSIYVLKSLGNFL